MLKSLNGSAEGRRRRFRCRGREGGRNAEEALRQFHAVLEDHDKKDVLPRVQIGNRLGAQCLYDHYIGGMTLGALARRLGLKQGSLVSFEKVAANLLEKTIDRLTEEYRSALVKHADETTWRCDGRNGYAWGFFTDNISIYRFRESRGSKVAVDVFGSGPHKGVLVVDRYAGYNPAWLGRMQYCFEHLKRDGKDILEKGVKDGKERGT